MLSRGERKLAGITMSLFAGMCICAAGFANDMMVLFSVGTVANEVIWALKYPVYIAGNINHFNLL